MPRSLRLAPIGLVFAVVSVVFPTGRAAAEPTKPAGGFTPKPGAVELPDLRTQSSKTFAKPDGTWTWSASVSEHRRFHATGRRAGKHRAQPIS